MNREHNNNREDAEAAIETLRLSSIKGRFLASFSSSARA